MIVHALIILSAQAAAAPAASADARPLLDEFRAVCDAVTDYPRLAAAATARGWETIEEGAHPQLARVNQVGREAVGSQGRMEGASFRRILDRRTLYLVVSRWEGDGGWGNGCRLYDFAAAAPIAPLQLISWMGRTPTKNHTFGALGSNLLWEPAWRPGLSVTVNHVPATSAFRERYGLSGNVLVAQAFGGN